MIRIPFNSTTLVGREREYVSAAIASNTLAGDGEFSKRCEEWLEKTIGTRCAMLTPSCTAALEMVALILGVQPGDEVIMPSFTFVSTANAFALRGAVPVFVDIRPDTLNIDETAIARAITSRTKAIVIVHYAGMPCAMDEILRIAGEGDIPVVEDAAHSILSAYNGKKLGSLGRFGCLSFHTSKNITCGHGGALLLNDPADLERAHILREKGTNRAQFLRGDIQKYSWVDVGSSYFVSDLCSAYLFGQLEQASAVNARRLAVCKKYYAGLKHLKDEGLVNMSHALTELTNGHIFYLLTVDVEARSKLLAHLRAAGVEGTFHYVPLHSAPAGRRLGRVSGSMATTDRIGQTIVRLPLFASITDEEVDHVIASVCDFFSH